jgi:hypothetical protein
VLLQRWIDVADSTIVTGLHACAVVALDVPVKSKALLVRL